MGNVQADRELDQLLQDHFEITTPEFVAALKRLPRIADMGCIALRLRSSAAKGCRLPGDGDAFLATSTDTAGHAAHLAATAFTAMEVATGLGVGASRVRQKRLTGDLWAIPDGQAWIFPALQFETAANGRPTRQIRGLDRVLKALPAEFHPMAVAGFLRTPQPGVFHGRAMTPLEWLRDGGDVDQAVATAEDLNWHTV
jgi:hypothetical protein